MIEVWPYALAWWQAILAVIVGVVGSARLTRVITYDDYPLTIKLRIWWDTVTHDGPWAKLAHCHWCMGPWVTLIALVSFLLSFLHPALGWAWWIFWGWLALSYWTSQYVHFDEGRGEDS
jgi:hypothetical protein